MMDAAAKWLFGEAVEGLEGLQFAFDTPWPQQVCWFLLAALAAATAVFFWTRMPKASRALRALLVALRAATAALAWFLLLDPCLVGKRVRPTDRAVLVLFDDSKSMQVSGADGRTRGRRLREAYESARADFENALREKCRLILCRFGESVERIQSLDDLHFEQSESDLTGAAEAALRDFEDVSVAAVVLFSDGVHQTRERPADLNLLERLKVPVFTVGVGAESHWRDLELKPPAVRRNNSDERSVAVKAPLCAVGLSGNEVVIEARAGGSILGSCRLNVESDDAELEGHLEFVCPAKEWTEVEVRARLASARENEPTTAAERIAQNNAHRVLVDNREKTWRILFLAGRPNWEHKFIRRALEDDKQLKLSSLIRISGPEKTFKYRGNRSNLANPIFEGTDVTPDMPRYDEALFLRLGMEPNELVKGYPQNAADLFPYPLIIWGEIEAEFFSQTQLELTRDYVRKRGGSLLLLGGRHSFAEGGFAGTIIETLMPVRLPRDAGAGKTPSLDPDRPYQVQPSVEGLLSGAWSLDPDPETNRRLWEKIGSLYRINPFALTRPGASIHVRAVSKDAEKDERPLFAVQRYGEGRCAVLATDSTWQWQLGADEADRVHERLWRQIIRSLAQESPEPIRLRAKHDTYTTGEPAEMEFIVRDAIYDERESLNVAVAAAAPSGRQTTLAVDESIREPGLYACRFVPEESGMYRLTLTALDDEGRTVGRLDEAVIASPDQREFQRAQYDETTLREMARRTGGAFFPIERLSEVARAIRWQPSQQADETRIHLWRFPVFYILLASLWISEWYMRRKKGYR